MIGIIFTTQSVTRIITKPTAGEAIQKSNWSLGDQRLYLLHIFTDDISHSSYGKVK